MAAVALLAAIAAVPKARAHDIPNQRVDRSIQAIVAPGRLTLDYEVSLTELTLTQDLRSLVGPRPGADRSEWLDLYGRVVGPLNARGFLVFVDGARVPLAFASVSLVVEEHPRYTFHLVGKLPARGRLRIRDTNYVSSEGTSRLALRGEGGAIVAGDDGPTDVEQVPIRPVWELDDAEERRTREIEVDYRGPLEPPALEGAAARTNDGPSRPRTIRPDVESDRPPEKPQNTGLFDLLDDRMGPSTWWLVLIAFGLGVAHSVQPGHGKSLVTAAALGPDARFYQPALLGLAATAAHVGSVFAIAALLWITGSDRTSGLHRGLAQAAGFAIAAPGFWRIGRHLGGFGEHEDGEEAMPRVVPRGDLALVGLGLAAGSVPCWDAIGLLIVAAAIGRLALGLGLVLSFSAGMAAVLIAVGGLAWKIKSAALGLEPGRAWRRRLGLLHGAVLAAVGLWLLFE